MGNKPSLKASQGLHTLSKGSHTLSKDTPCVLLPSGPRCVVLSPLNDDLGQRVCRFITNDASPTSCDARKDYDIEHYQCVWNCVHTMYLDAVMYNMHNVDNTQPLAITWDNSIPLQCVHAIAICIARDTPTDQLYQIRTFILRVWQSHLSQHIGLSIIVYGVGETKTSRIMHILDIARGIGLHQTIHVLSLRPDQQEHDTTSVIDRYLEWLWIQRDNYKA